jgi:hypothetical protein
LSITTEHPYTTARNMREGLRAHVPANVLVAVFAVAVFASAFLLFQVQPLTSKFILPWFGGSPAVWTSAMLFYQVLLFGGYLYAHCSSTYLSWRAQFWTHVGALALGTAVVLWLRITPPQWLRPVGDENASPLGEILFLLGITVGLPYFALSATGPLLQKWFSDAFDGASPYRLFALSNAGSLLALLSYPFLVEVYWGSSTQALFWSMGFLAFAGVCVYCAWSTYQIRRSHSTSAAARHRAASHEVPPGAVRRLSWLLLPTLASVMFLAVTNEVCQNVATVPLLWIVPLSLYLLTFIIAFDHPRWYWRPVYLAAALVLLVAMADYDTVMGTIDTALTAVWPAAAPWALADSWGAQCFVYFAGFFCVAMVCHGELAHRKPSQKYLTGYYLTMSLGGAVGGILVNLIAPQVFTSFFEWSLGLFLSVAMIVGLTVANNRAFQSPAVRPILLTLGVAALLLVGRTQLYDAAYANTPSESRTVLHQSRNFFGMIAVQRRAQGDADENYTFFSGHIQHGKQLADPQRRNTPLTYYGDGSGIQHAIKHVQDKSSSCRLGVVGLGIGTLAAYGRPSDQLRFYEINPDVVTIARNTEWFHFLHDCPSQTEVVLGDARLQLEREFRANGSHQFHVLCIDAFSGDAIPSHLLTREAFEVYKQHLRPDGILALHITNTYLDLYPVVKQLAEHHGFRHTRVYAPGDYDKLLYRNYYVLVTNDESFLEKTPPQIEELPGYLARDIETPLWTDEYHSLWPLLR